MNNIDELEIAKQKLSDLWKCHNTAGWAKGQLHIIVDMVEDRVTGKIAHPISQKFLLEALRKIENGIELMPQ